MSRAEWVKAKGTDELRQILFWCWDPIGINEAFPDAADEYDSYIPTLLSRLLGGATASEVADYLIGVEVDLMGLPSRPAVTLSEVAERVVDWYESSPAGWEES